MLIFHSRKEKNNRIARVTEGGEVKEEKVEEGDRAGEANKGRNETGGEAQKKQLKEQKN